MTEHSEFFKKALQGPWKEAADGTVILEDVEPVVFNIFVEWLYTGEIPKKKDDEESDNAEDDEDDIRDGEHEDQDDDYGDGEDGLEEAYISSLVKTYTLGDRFLAPRYKHAVLDRLVEHMEFGIRPTWFRAIAYAYNNLPEKDPMLEALVDVHCRYWNDGRFLSKEQKEHAKLVPTEFWIETSNVWEELCNPSGPRECEFFSKPLLKPCDYHYHHQYDDCAERKKCEERHEATVQEYWRARPWLARDH